VPDEVVVRCGLCAGVELDRPLLRRVRRALRDAEARTDALRALERRPLSERRLRARLRGRGTPPVVEAATVESLARAGLVDDERLAHGRAEALAARGWGNAAVAARLEEEGIAAGLAAAAVAALPPESERAAGLVSGLPKRKAWGLLARRGFDPDAAANLLGPLDGDT
jgi:SOS response regulatory protein OraA/RecX